MKQTGAAEGLSDLRPAEYPGTISLDSPETIFRHLGETTVPQIVEALTRPIAGRGAPAEVGMGREIVYSGSLQEVNDHFAANWWTDGLPIIPPTVERVAQFLEWTDLASDAEVAVLRPGSVRVTPWHIAVNGVMAGCRPEHMPLLVAAVEGIGDPRYNLEQLGSTGGWNMFFVVNGPIAKQLGVQHGVGLVSLGANPAIGRALGLIRHNLAGLRPGEVYMGTFGYFLPPVFAEDEEALADIGWSPCHVDAGCEAGTSAVSVCGTAKWGYQMYPTGSDPERLAQLLAYDVARAGSPNHSAGQQRSPRLVFPIFLTPGVARTFAEAGYSKAAVREAIWRQARYTLAEVDFESYYGAHEGQRETHRDLIAKGKLPEQRIERGRIPAWFPPVADGAHATIPVAPAPEQLPLIVCGDPTRNKTMTFYTMYNTFVTKPVRLPAGWAERVQALGCQGACDI